MLTLVLREVAMMERVTPLTSYDFTAAIIMQNLVLYRAGESLSWAVTEVSPS